MEVIVATIHRCHHHCFLSPFSHGCYSFESVPSTVMSLYHFGHCGTRHSRTRRMRVLQTQSQSSFTVVHDLNSSVELRTELCSLACTGEVTSNLYDHKRRLFLWQYTAHSPPPRAF